MDFLKAHQLNIMLVMNGACGILTLLVFFARTLSKRRRFALFMMEVSSVLLLIADRFGYLYLGNPSRAGYYIERIANYVLYVLPIVIFSSFNLYLSDLYTHEGGLKKVPKRLVLAEIFAFLDIVSITISQRYDFYYYLDAVNDYHRSKYYICSFIAPAAILVLQFSMIIQYYFCVSRRVRVSMLVFTTLPFVATLVQLFFYGVSLINIAFVIDTTLFYIFVLMDMNDTVKRAMEREIEVLKEEQQNMHKMFVQTAEALASAIDAKDTYTHGHSARVAEYSKQIARQAGKDEKECREIYFAALLHDVGKIGIPDYIINKAGKLNDEEFSEIRKHPEIGRQILQNIIQSPYISIGAHYHHERYDGSGYPDGLRGSEIPEIARIIAVADAYDAMASKRSYRDPLAQNIVREEIEKGLGTQFDPTFATIMLKLIDTDKDYLMRER